MVGFYIFNLFCNIGPVFQGISVAQGIGQGNLGMALLFVGSLYGGLQVSQVVQTVKNTDNINAVSHGFLDKIFHHIISIVVVAQNILSAEQHLQLGILKACLQLSETLPRIFL